MPARTLVQRVAPADALARMFGLLQMFEMAGLAVGSLLVAALVAWGGVQAAILGVGLLLPLAAVAAGRNLLSIDRHATVPVVEIGLLRGVPLFAPLDPTTLEALRVASRLSIWRTVRSSCGRASPATGSTSSRGLDPR